MNLNYKYVVSVNSHLLCLLLHLKGTNRITKAYHMTEALAVLYKCR